MPSILRVLPVHQWLSDLANASHKYFFDTFPCVFAYLFLRVSTCKTFDRNSFVRSLGEGKVKSSNINEENQAMMTFLK